MIAKGDGWERIETTLVAVTVVAGAVAAVAGMVQAIVELREAAKDDDEDDSDG